MSSNIHILVVDDEEHVGVFTKEACEDWGYESEYCINSKSALEYFSTHPVDIVILDIDLREELTGIDLIPRFKMINPNVIIIMLSAQNDIRVGIQAMSKGAFDYHLKPFDYSYMRERIKLAVEASLANRLKKLYVSAMVHDLSNPAQCIKISLAMIKRLLDSDPESSFKYIDLALSASHQMETMIQNMLSLEKMAQGKYQSKNEELTPIDLLNNDLKPVLETSEVPIKIENNIPEGVSFQADRNLLAHVLLNLLSNAQRHSYPKMDPILLTFGQEKDETIMTITNWGSYVAPEKTPLIFEPFYQGKKGEKVTNANNFGFGLSFCKAAVECMGGKISVSSDPQGNSTTFKINIKG